MGRPKKPVSERLVTLTVYITPQAMAKIRAIADRRRCSVSSVAASLIGCEPLADSADPPKREPFSQWKRESDELRASVGMPPLDLDVALFAYAHSSRLRRT